MNNPRRVPSSHPAPGGPLPPACAPTPPAYITGSFLTPAPLSRRGGVTAAGALLSSSVPPHRTPNSDSLTLPRTSKAGKSPGVDCCPQGCQRETAPHPHPGDRPECGAQG